MSGVEILGAVSAAQQLITTAGSLVAYLANLIQESRSLPSIIKKLKTCLETVVQSGETIVNVFRTDSFDSNNKHIQSQIKRLCRSNVETVEEAKRVLDRIEAKGSKSSRFISYKRKESELDGLRHQLTENLDKVKNLIPVLALADTRQGNTELQHGMSHLGYQIDDGFNSSCEDIRTHVTDELDLVNDILEKRAQQRHETALVDARDRDAAMHSKMDAILRSQEEHQRKMDALEAGLQANTSLLSNMLSAASWLFGGGKGPAAPALPAERAIAGTERPALPQPPVRALPAPAVVRETVLPGPSRPFRVPPSSWNEPESSSDDGDPVPATTRGDFYRARRRTLTDPDMDCHGPVTRGGPNNLWTCQSCAWESRVYSAPPHSEEVIW